nr:choice-of-anchor D domain-containing protein [Archangium primigenium]
MLAACGPPSSSGNEASFAVHEAALEVKLGTGPAPLIAPDVPSLSFPTQRVCGTGTELTLTVFNDDATDARTLLFTETSDPFAVTDIRDEDGTARTLPFSLGAQKRMSFRVKFNPRAPASFNGQLQIFSDDSVRSTLRIALSGTGTGPHLELNPTSLVLSGSPGTQSGPRSALLFSADDAGTDDAGTPADAGTDDAGTDDAGTPADAGTGDGGVADTSFRRTVTLTNRGTERLTSLALSSASPAFTASLSKTALEPGESASLVVTFAPPAASSAAFFTDTLLITSDDPCSPALQLPLSGFRAAGAAPTLNPTQLSFADQDVGTLSATQTVTLTNEGAAQLTVDSVSLQGASDSASQFIVSPQSGFVLQPGHQRSLSVRFNPTTAGDKLATLQLIQGGAALTPTTQLSGKAVQAPLLQLTPQSLVFPKQRPGAVTQQTVTVENPGSVSLQFSAALAPSTPAGFDFEPKGTFTLAPHATQQVTVTLAPASTAVSGPVLGQLAFTSRDTVTSSTRETPLPLQGEVVRTRIVLSTATVSFADQVVGATPQIRGLVLQNPTDLPIKVYAVVPGTLGPFALQSGDLPVDIPAHGAHGLTLSFDPTSRQQWDATLRLTSDATEPIAPVALSGKALAPVLSITDPVSQLLDFGPRAPGSETPRSVTLKNTGDADLVLTRTSLLADFRLQGLSLPRTVAPNDTVTFQVVFAPTSLGDKTESLQFHLGGSSTPLASPQLPLRGKGSGATPAMSPALVAFVDQEVGTISAAQGVSITNSGAAPLIVDTLAIQGPSDSGSQFTVIPTTGFVLEPGHQRDVLVKFNPSTAGDKQATLQLIHNGTALAASTRLTGRGVQAPLLQLTPQSLVFAKQRPGQVGQQTLTLENPGSVSVQVTAALDASTPAGFDFEPKSTFTLAPHATQQVTVTLAPASGAASGPLLGQLTVTSRDSTSPMSRQIPVPLRGEVVRTRVELSTPLLSFADQVVGSTPQAQELVLTNPTALPVRVYAVVPGTLGPYAIKSGDLPVDIPANDSRGITVSFDPTSRQQWEATLRLTSDATEAIAPVRLTGKALAPVVSITDPVSLELDFDLQAPGSTTRRSVALKNTGDADLVLTRTSILADFRLQGLNPPRTLVPNETVTFDVLFTPTSVGNKMEELQFYLGASSTPLPSPRLTLRGRAVGATPAMSPALLAFADQEVGSVSTPQTVTVSNQGAAALTVDSLSLQSTDTTAQFTVSPSGGFVLAPSEQRALSVRFNPTTAGDKQALLQLVSNGTTLTPSTRLTGKAVLPPLLQLTPQALTFPKQRPGVVAQQTVTVENPGSVSLQVTATLSASTPAAFDFEPKSTFTLAPHATQQVTVTLAPASSASSGVLNGQLTLTSRDLASSSTRQGFVPLQGEVVRTRVEPSTTTVSFTDQVVGGTPQAQGLVLRNPTALPVRVHAVAAGTLGPYAIKAGDLPVDIPAHDTKSITLFFDPASRQQWETTLQLTSDATEAIAPVRLTGRALAPVLTVTDPVSSSLDFGLHAPGSETRQNVTVKNTGDADLVLTRHSTLTDFKVEGLNPPRTLVPNDTVTFEVVFAPTSAGSKGETLQFYVGASSTPLTTPRLTLSGRAAGAVPAMTPALLAFGNQEVGTTSATQTVTVSNQGAAPLVVDSLSLQSTDSTAQFIVSPSGGFILAPSAQRVLSVRFNPTSFGDKQATLQLIRDGTALATTTRFTGTGVQAPLLQLTPHALTFPKQRPGEVTQQTVSIENPGLVSLDVTAAVAATGASTAFDFEPKGTFTLGPGGKQQMTVTLKPATTAASGLLLGQLNVTGRDSQANTSRQATLPLQGEVVRTRVEPSTTTVSFTDQVVGSTPQAQGLVLRNPTALPVRVYTVAAGTLGPYSVKAGDLPVDIPANDAKSITLYFDPVSRQPWETTLRLTSDATEAVAPVRLVGTALAPVLTVIDPVGLNVDFGPQALGTETPRSVTLKNTGDAELTLARTSTMENYKVQGLNPPRTVAPNATVTFEVVFAPTSLGLKEESLQFYVGTPGTLLPSPQIKLSGTASGPSATVSGDLDYRAQRINEPTSRKLRISNDRLAPETLEIVSITIKDKTVEFSLGGSYTGQKAGPGEFLDIEVIFRPTIVDRTSTDSLRIEYKGTLTGVPVTRFVPLSGVGATALLDVESILSFGDVELNQAKSLSLTLTNKGKSPLRLNSLEGLTGSAFLLGQINWPREVPPDGTEVISITFAPNRLDAVTADLVIASNATSSNVTAGKTTIRLSGRGAAAKALFEPTTLVVENTPLGQTGLGRLRVSNVGSSPLRINKVNPSPHFRVRAPAGDWPVVIDIKDKDATQYKYYDFVIEFHPDALPKVSETLVFPSNDSLFPLTSVTVEGAGSKPKLVVDSVLLFDKVALNPGGTGYQAMIRNLQVKNEGTAPLVIRSLQLSSHFCVKLTLSGDCIERTLPDFAGITLLPNEAQLLQVQVTPTSEKMSGSLSLSTNEESADGFTKTVALLVGVDGVSVPTETVEFGTCDMNKLPTTLVEKGVGVTNTAEAEDSITSVTFSEADALDFSVVNVTASTPLKVPGRGGVELKLAFKPRIGAAGTRTATAHLYTRTGKKLELKLKGVATGLFSGFKDFAWEVDFGTQRLSEPKPPVRFPLHNQLDRSIFVKRVWVDGAQKEDFTAAADGGGTCRTVGTTQEIEIRMGETCELLLTYAARRVTLSSAVLVLELATSTSTSAEQPPAARVALKGEMVSSVLLVDPMEVDFGWVDLGQTIEPREITLTNQSRTGTRVLIPEVTHPELFTVEALEPGKELPPGGTTRLRVTFHPSAAGDSTGELQLRLQGDNATDVTVGLRGQVRAFGGEGGGSYGCGATGGGHLAGAWLLLMALGLRYRSRRG